MSQLSFTIESGTTSPPLDAALLDEDGQIIGLVGASAEFSLYELGGEEIFTRTATVVSAPDGHVRHSWQAGDTNTPGRYLGKFHVTFASLEEREYPEDRYIRITVT